MKRIFKRGNCQILVRVQNAFKTLLYLWQTNHIPALKFLGKKELVRYSNINIYTESLCLCPNLLLERRYIVMGAESKNKKTRLLINCNSTILESTPFWKKVIRQWKKSSMNSQMQMVSQRKIGFNKYWSDFKKVHPLYKDGVPFT